MKHMYSHYLLLLTLLLTPLSFNAQTSFSWINGNSYSDTTLATNSYTELKLEFSNETNDSLRIGVKVTYNDLPASWDGMVCVFGKCLGTIPASGDSATMVDMDTSDIGYVRLTVNPYTGNQVATLKIWTYNLDNPSDGDTATWHIDQTSVGLNEISKPTIYPNPASDFIVIEGEQISQALLSDMHGHIIRSMSTTGKLNIVGLPKGMYLLTIEDINNQRHSEVIIIQ